MLQYAELIARSLFDEAQNIGDAGLIEEADKVLGLVELAVISEQGILKGLASSLTNEADSECLD